MCSFPRTNVFKFLSVNFQYDRKSGENGYLKKFTFSFNHLFSKYSKSIQSERRVSTPDSVINERSAIMDQFRERYEFHFKNFIESDGSSTENDEKLSAGKMENSKSIVTPQKLYKDEDNNDIIPKQ